MLKDVDFNHFPAVYVVGGRTDMRYGIDSLTAIIERRFKVDLFVPNTLFLFCGTSAAEAYSMITEIMHLDNGFDDLSNTDRKKQRQHVLQDKADAYFEWIKLKYSQVTHIIAPSVKLWLTA